MSPPRVPPHPARSARARIWQSIRVLRQFDLATLAATAEAQYHNVSCYVRALRRVGVVRRHCGHRPGVPGAGGRYALIRDLGPYAPRTQMHGGVYDANAHQTLYPESKEATDD
ncbi:hypothetical protein [Thioalkalivibrio sp. ALMg9]|uniref:hypothetical protein n=1 Tax=Thioalkalivibrio sp. ALMg9 TaxID=1266912 RepID=UPI0003769E17|nr:hypothetical protein [Thioalkalivibrio sp. ALMg9]